MRNELQFTKHLMSSGLPLKGTADLRRYFSDALSEDSEEVTRVLFLTSRLLGILYLEISPAVLSQDLIVPIMEQGVQFEAAAYVVFDHFPSGLSCETERLNTQTLAYRRVSRDYNISLLDHIVIVRGRWFGQTFQKEIAFPTA